MTYEHSPTEKKLKIFLEWPPKKTPARSGAGQIGGFMSDLLCLETFSAKGSSRLARIPFAALRRAVVEMFFVAAAPACCAWEFRETGK